MDLVSTTSITQQQAVALLPLLQKIANSASEKGEKEVELSGENRAVGCKVDCGNGSTKSTAAVHRSTEIGDLNSSGSSTSKRSRKYSCEELYKKKPKFSKASEAHSFCHVSYHNLSNI